MGGVVRTMDRAVNIVCARCKRALSREPIVVGGHGYGPRCAAMVGDLATPLVGKRVRVIPSTPRQRKNERQMDLLEAQ